MNCNLFINFCQGCNITSFNVQSIRSGVAIRVYGSNLLLSGILDFIGFQLTFMGHLKSVCPSFFNDLWMDELFASKDGGVRLNGTFLRSPYWKSTFFLEYPFPTTKKHYLESKFVPFQSWVSHFILAKDHRENSRVSY